MIYKSGAAGFAFPPSNVPTSSTSAHAAESEKFVSLRIQPQDRRCIRQVRPANLISRWLLPLNINLLYWEDSTVEIGHSIGTSLEKKKIRYIRNTSLTLMQPFLLVT